MREIDDRYPEYARPYEPVKGGRHHGRLSGNEGNLAVLRRVRHLDRARRGFLMGVGVLILLTILIGPILPPERPTPPPDVPPEIQPTPPPDEPTPPPDEPTPPPDEPTPPPDEPTPPPDEPTPPPDEPDPPPDEPDPPQEEFTPPGFTELFTERAYNPGVDEEYVEMFYYGFTLELNEADRDQPVTVRLEYYDKENDTWNDCPDRGDTERTRTYSGSDEPWEDYLCYDVLDLDMGNERGRLWQVRIACDYTLPDGSQGTVYSTDCSELYAFKGEYVEAVSATLENDVLTAVFRVDTDVLLDTSPDKLTVSQMSLSGGSGFYHWWDLTDKATISPAAEDGTITVTYTLTDEEVDLSETLRAGLALRYNDRDGAIADWESFDAVVVEIPHIAPIIELDPYVYGPYVEGAWYSTLYVKMTLNDLEGGKAVGTLYYDTGNGFEKVPPNPEFEEYEDYTGTVEYGGEDDYGSVEDGVWYVYAPFAIDPPEGGGYLAQAKIVFDITYPDGYTDTIETEIRPIHMGIFIRYNTDYGNNGWELGEVYNPETGATRYTMSFDVTVDDTLVVPEEVEINSHYLRLWKPTTRYEDGEIERFTDDAGTYHILYTYFSDEPFPDGEYWFNPEPYYQIDENNGWSTYNVYFRFIKEMEGQHRAPIMEILDEEMENDPSNYLPVMVTLNDLRGGTATATLYRQNENGRFEPLTGEGASATYDPSEETGSVWTFRLYDEYLEEYDGTGAKDRVKVVLEYTYPDGETGSREQERFIYLGYYAWFTTAAAPVYDPEAGTVTADLIVVDALMDAEDIWFAYKYMYNQDSDETVYGYSWPDGEIIDMGNGTHVIRFTITTGQLEAGRYYMEIGIRYLDDCYGYWNCVAWTEFTVQ